MRHVKKGDEVIITSGKDSGRRGTVLFVDTKKNRVKVEKVNLIKRHVRPNQKNPQGGIVEKEGTVHISNVRLWDPKAQAPTRTRVKLIEGEHSGKKQRKIRESCKTGETFGE